MPVPLSFGCIKVGAPHSDIFNFKSTPICQSLTTSFLKADLYSLGTGYSLTWYIFGLVPGCSYISTGLVFQVPDALLKRKLCLLNMLCIIK